MANDASDIPLSKTVELRFDDLLTDFGAYIGEPRKRRSLIRRLVSWGMTEEDADTLRWFFDYTEKSGTVDSMGWFVVSRLQNRESAEDTLKGAGRLCLRLAGTEQDKTFQPYPNMDLRTQARMRHMSNILTCTHGKKASESCPDCQKMEVEE